MQRRTQLQRKSVTRVRRQLRSQSATETTEIKTASARTTGVTGASEQQGESAPDSHAVNGDAAKVVLQPGQV